MAEEKVDGLEGLDDFGDDFGEQLDSFMENEGEEESDSELDSFFEDLSTIDDLEGDDDSETAEDKTEEEKTDEVKSDDENDGDVDEDDGDEDNEELDDDYDTELEDESDDKVDDTSTAKQKKKKGLLKPLIISIITGLLLGVITVVVLYFFATPAEKTLFETVVEIPTEPVPPVKVSKPEPKKAKTKAKTKAKAKAKTKAKTTSYYVQVVSCISHECVNESRLQLKTLGYKSRVRSSNESSGISEVLSTKFFGEEFSARMVKKINNNNPLAGHAFRKSMENGYQVSLGLFPDLETANRVRTYLNQAFKEDIFFKIQRATQKIRFQAVQIAGFKSKKDAVKLRDKLRKNHTNFQSAFVKADIKP